MRRTYLRARAPGEKAERRDAILTAARALWHETAFADFTMSALAERAGLAKGTVYLYFTTKESVFAQLLVDELDAWSAAVELRLGRLAGSDEPVAVARALAASLEQREDFTRLLALLEPVLERNLDDGAVLALKRTLLARTASIGALLERALPRLPKGGGLTLLVRVRALVTGLRLMADPSPAVQRALAADASLAPFAVAFAPHVRAGIAALVIGTLSGVPPAPRARPRARTRKGHRT